MQNKYDRNLGEYYPTGETANYHEKGFPVPYLDGYTTPYRERLLNYYERARYEARRDYHLRADRSIRR